jgi:glutathione synthase/RimK-type ligase-like ATP-grasp enzyme
VILVCGNAGDRVTRFLCQRLDVLGAKNELLDLARYPVKHQVTQYRGRHGSGVISWPECTLPTSELTGVFVRELSNWNDDPGARFDPALSAALHAEKTLGLASFWAELDCVIVNPFAGNWSNQSKPYQTLIAARTGLFEIPRTLITNDRQEITRFYEQMAGQVIHKSSSGRSIGTRLVTSNDLADLIPTRDTPVQLQERVSGVDIRVHVVREQIFATKIRCDAVDYRWARTEQMQLEAWELPSNVASECIRLTKQLGLLFCGIDLRENPEGKYYFFEANPAPDFAFYEVRTGQEISVALRDVLSA